MSVRVSWGAAPAKPIAIDIATSVENILAVPAVRLDYATAKLSLDRLIDPTLDNTAITATLDRMVAQARLMAGPAAGSDAKLTALRRLVYEAGDWNDHRPFAYDQADPLGQAIGGKLLATYLRTRRGNCVSMPILFLILADKLGINMSLAAAPLHIFLRYRAESGRVLNLEATSGAHPARTDWYRRNMPMSDRAIASGIYMRSLPKREGVALMATTVLEHLMAYSRFNDALRVSEAILRHAPCDAYTMVKQGSACGELMRVEYDERYRTRDMIPLPLRARFLMLAQRNQATFEAAEALGWEPVE